MNDRKYSKYIALLLCTIVSVLEVVGLKISAERRGIALFCFYTQLSNIMNLVSTLAYIVTFRSKNEEVHKMVRRLRYIGTCMLLMTFIVTVGILIPLGANPRRMLLMFSGLYHHLLCPLISIPSYILFEKHHFSRHSHFVPMAMTLAYGLIMIGLNATKTYLGPYPFFKVYKYGIGVTLFYLAVLMIIITVICYVVNVVGEKLDIVVEEYEERHEEFLSRLHSNR
jgi:hypothetical protein